MKTSDFPMAIYRRGSLPGQIDHPGWLSKVVPDQAALDVALAEGWQIEMRDAPVSVDDEMERPLRPRRGFDYDPSLGPTHASPLRQPRGWARKE